MVVEHGEKSVKVVVTFGLVALVVFAAGLVVVGERIAPRVEAGLGIRQEAYPSGNVGISYDDNKNAPVSPFPVNETASREKKKGPPIDCPPCDLLTVQQLSNMPPTNAPLDSAATEQKCSISLFVGTDPRSQELLRQWNTDARLQALRKQVNFNAYTRDNKLYRERYANIVPSEQFPALIMSDGRGGHIYAAGNAALPSTADAQLAAIQHAIDAYTSAHKQPVEPTPDMLFASGPPNCPDGNCEPGREPWLNPSRTPLLPMLRDQQRNPIESILYWIWNPGEAVLVMLCALVFCALLGVVVLKIIKS